PEVFSDFAKARARFRLVPQQPVECQFYLDHIADHSIAKVAGGWKWKFDPLAVAHPRPNDFTEALLNMRCRVAFLIGQLSQRVDEKSRRYMRRALGDRFPIVELPNSRHHVML